MNIIDDYNSGLIRQFFRINQELIDNQLATTMPVAIQ